MALKLDENYNGSTLLSEWWQSVKNNFTVLASAIEQEISDRGDAVMAEKLERAAAIAEAVSEEKSEREAADAAEKSEREAAVAAEKYAREIEIAEERSQREALAEDVGDIQTLTTSDRSSVVNAINSLKNMISAISVSKSGLNVLSDYGVEYAQENSVTNVYAQGTPDNMPMGVYVFTPEQDVHNIFLVSADGTEELANYSGELYAENTYLLEFYSDSSRVIAEFENNAEELEAIETAIAEIDEELALIKENVSTLTGQLEKTDVAVRVIEQDYLKSEDKTEINGSVAEIKNVADAALDQAQMNAESIAELRDKITANTSVAPEFANSVDECTDTTKMYVLPDGYIYAYMTTENPETTVANFTNQLDVVGYTADSYLNSSGGVGTKAGYGTTGFIPIPTVTSHDAGQVVLRFADIEAVLSDTYTRVSIYDSEKTWKKTFNLSSSVEEYTQGSMYHKLGEDGYVNELDLSTYIMSTCADGAYIRFCASGLDDESVVTLNEPIEYITTGGESVSGWTNTGHAFVASDYEERIADLENEVDAVKQQLAEDGSVPDYITEEAERVANNVQAARTAKSLVFPVMSDFHLFDGNSNHDNSLLSAYYAGMGIKELKKRIHLDFTAYLGDYTWGAADHSAEQIMKDITAVKETTDTTDTEIWCVGNHDLNYGADRDRLLTLDEIYSYIGANSDGVKPYENIERGYGYMDFENQKIRVIYLNTCDTSDWAVTDGENARAEWVSPTQIQWLADTALDFSDKALPGEWGIVIAGHHPLHYGYSCFDSVMKLLEAYKDGLSGTLSCTVCVDTADDGTETYPQQSVTYDFSNTERAEIICNIHGHNHNCGYSQISSSTRTGSTEVAPWLWRISIPNICANRYNTAAEVGELYGEYDESGNPVYWEKETGTAKATSFCVISIDRKNRKIHAYSFGAGVDREISY